jgi:DNA-directed RNA polymerase subunit RPC12/RpoP
MNLGSNRWKANYVCDKCGSKISYIAKKGFVGINHYYKSIRGNSTPHKDFDLCGNCEKKFREWLNTKEVPTLYDVINSFPRWS